MRTQSERRRRAAARFEVLEGRCLLAAPLALEDVFIGAAGQPQQVAAPGVLLNDLGFGGGNLTAQLVGGPAHGTLSLSPGGAFTYTPIAGFTGTDSFTYTASDGTSTSDPATVLVAGVAGATRAIAANQFYGVVALGTLNAPFPGLARGALAVAPPIRGALALSQPRNGTLQVNSDATFTYTPTPGFIGTDSFTFQVIDGNGLSQNIATTTLSVVGNPDAPTVLSQVYGTTNTSALVVAAPGVLAGATNPTTNPLTAQLVGGPAHGTLGLNPDGSFVYTPTAGFVGNDSFTYRASNVLAQSNVATAQIGVSAASTMAAPLSATLEQASDLGVSSVDGITSSRTPTVTGAATPGWLVTLYATPSGGSPAAVGSALVAPDGTFRVTSNPLGDGNYTLGVTAYDATAAGAQPGPIVPVTTATGQGTVVIDTAAPVVDSVSLDARHGDYYVTYRDTGSGSLARALLATNYSVTRPFSPYRQGRDVPVTGVTVLNQSPGLLTVLVNIGNGRQVPHGRLVLRINSGGANGVADAAGNALDGEFVRRLPSGDGQPGGDFLARIDVNRGRSTAARPVILVPAPTVVPTPSPRLAVRLRRRG